MIFWLVGTVCAATALCQSKHLTTYHRLLHISHCLLSTKVTQNTIIIEFHLSYKTSLEYKLEMYTPVFYILCHFDCFLGVFLFLDEQILDLKLIDCFFLYFFSFSSFHSYFADDHTRADTHTHPIHHVSLLLVSVMCNTTRCKFPMQHTILFYL